jgi:hypothetical protein
MRVCAASLDWLEVTIRHMQAAAAVRVSFFSFHCRYLAGVIDSITSTTCG